MKKDTIFIIDAVKLNDGSYPLTISKQNPNSYQANPTKKNNSVDEWQRKLGNLIPSHLNKLSELKSIISTFDRELVNQH